jgi:HD-like signal output (HDOD) protein/ActR/RegA family two-component response regulator
MKKSVLFVDDEPKVLQALRHLIAHLQDDWEAEYCESGPQALVWLNKRPFNVVVSDFEMPGMSGGQLLSEVMRIHPHATRIILCWPSDRPHLSELFGTAHQYLFKPCDAKILKDSLSSVLACSTLLSNGKLTQLISQLKSVPSLPNLYVELMREMRSDEASLPRAGQIISRDPGMTAKILQLVNSSFFGLARHVKSPEEAALYLGIETVKALVLSLQIFTQFDRACIQACNLSSLWNHSWETGVLARDVARQATQDGKIVDHAFLAGLLHDIGKLVLAANLPELYRASFLMAQHKQISIIDAEQEVFGASHAEVGGYLLGLWGLPDPIVEAVTFHHYPSWVNCQYLSALTAVHVANSLSVEGNSRSPVAPVQVDLNYLAGLDLMENFASWQAHCWGALAKSTPEASSISV